MTRLYFNRFGAHAFRHEALEIRVDGPILRRYRIPARLGPPCGVGCLIGKQYSFERGLNGVQDARLLRRYVPREVAQERLLTEPSIVA